VIDVDELSLKSLRPEIVWNLLKGLV
jgi:hypothetical protein